MTHLGHYNGLKAIYFTQTKSKGVSTQDRKAFHNESTCITVIVHRFEPNYLQRRSMNIHLVMLRACLVS